MPLQGEGAVAKCVEGGRKRGREREREEGVCVGGGGEGVGEKRGRNN